MNHNIIAFYTLVRREMKRILRIWMQTLLPPIITTALYFVIFGHIIGERIGSMAGVTYTDYIAPGLIMLAIILNSYSNTVFSFFSTKFLRNIQEMLVAPMSIHTIIWGFAVGGICRGLLAGGIVGGMSYQFTHLAVASPLLTVLVAVLTALLFSLAGLLNGIFSEKSDDTALVPTFVLTPLTYLSGIFYAVDLLPPVWQRITHLNPLFYIIGAFRQSILGFGDVSLQHALWVIGLAIVGLYICVWSLLAYGVRTRT